jgi:hypothetical protein
MRFAPRTFEIEKLKENIRQIEKLRNILAASNAFGRTISDMLLVRGDEAYRLALMYYTSLRGQARAGVPGAEDVFRVLQPFFRRPRRKGAEPTQKEVMRDFKAVLHGTKEGRVVVENVRPHAEGGVHEVVDEVR